MGLIGITGKVIVIHTIATSENTAYLNGGALRHVHYRTTGEAFLIASTISSPHLSAHEVDDGGYGILYIF